MTSTSSSSLLSFSFNCCYRERGSVVKNSEYVIERVITVQYINLLLTLLSHKLYENQKVHNGLKIGPKWIEYSERYRIEPKWTYEYRIDRIRPIWTE